MQTLTCLTGRVSRESARRYKDGQGYGIRGANMFDLNLSPDQVSQIMTAFLDEQTARKRMGRR